MKYFVWRNEPKFLAVAHAETVDEARGLLRYEMGDGDGSSPIRDEARRFIQENTPAIWVGHAADFVLTDSAELIEQEEENTRLWKKIKEFEKTR